MATETRKIFIVEGRTGEYSDHRAWPVAAYFDEAMAQKHAMLAANWMAVNRGAVYYQKTKENPYDAHAESDYTGTDYTAYAVDIRTEVPTDEVKG